MTGDPATRPLDGRACGELAAYLTVTEATRLADHIDAGEPTHRVLAVPAEHRRKHVARLIAQAGGPRPDLVPVLRAIAGALGQHTRVDPVLTAPGTRAAAGRLTGAAVDLVRSARTSVVCSTYNFERSSRLWDELVTASARPDLSVRIYVDGKAAAGTARQAASDIRGAQVFRTTKLTARRVRNHAKFVAVDHRWLLVTSANFSISAERFNLELGVTVDDPRLTQLVERQWASVERELFARVRA